MSDFWIYSKHPVRAYFMSHLLWFILIGFLLFITIPFLYDLTTESEKTPSTRSWKFLSELRKMECEELREYIIQHEGFFLHNVGEAKELFKYKGCEL